MTSVIAYAVLAIYSIALLYITVYCLMQFNLLYHYKKFQRDEEQPPVDQEIHKRVYARQMAMSASHNY